MFSRLQRAVRPVSLVALQPRVIVARPVTRPVKAIRTLGAAAPATSDADNHVHHHYVWESGRRTAEEGDWVISLPSDPLADAEVVLMGETIVVPPLYETLEGPTSTPMDFHTYEETPAVKETIVDEKSHDSKHEE